VAPLQVDMICLGLLRPIWGVISDRYGAKNASF
jgi:nitrate/nitrite transporter NarK